MSQSAPLLPGVDRGTIVKIVAVYLVVAGIVGLCGGLALLGVGGLASVMGIGGAGFFATAPGGTEAAEAAAASAGLAFVGGLAVVMGILSLIAGPAQIIVAVGLFQRASWARMGTVIVAAVSAVIALVSLLIGSGISQLLWVIVSGFVAYFFYTDPEIKQILS